MGANNHYKRGIPEWLTPQNFQKLGSKKDNAAMPDAIPQNGKVQKIVVSYICNACHRTFSDKQVVGALRKAAKNGDSNLSCIECGGVLRDGRVVMVPVASGLLDRRELYTTEPSNSRVPNSWVDKAAYGRMVHALGKMCAKIGLFNPQLRFQRGIRGSIRGGESVVVKEAEFSVEYFDNSGVRNKFYVTTSLTPAGEVISPVTFKLASGVEYPFTKEAISQLEKNKLFDPQSPQQTLPRSVYRDSDFTRWPHAYSSNLEKIKKCAAVIHTAEDPTFQNAVMTGGQYYKNMGADSQTAANKVSEDLAAQGLTPDSSAVVLDKMQQLYGEGPLQTVQDMGLTSPTATINEFVKTVKLANYENAERDLFSDKRVTDAYITVIAQRKQAWKEILLNTYKYVLAQKHPKERAIEAALRAVGASYSVIRPEIVDAVHRAVAANLSFKEATVEIQKTTGCFLSYAEWNEANGIDKLASKLEKMSATPVVFNPGQIVDYMGKSYVVDRMRPDTGAVILRSETDGDMAIVPPERQYLVQSMGNQYSIGDAAAEQSEQRPYGTFTDAFDAKYGPFDTTSAASQELIKNALRDEISYMPSVETDPEYSLSEQTQQSEPAFDKPYSEMDQGILPDEERNYLHMFRDSSLDLSISSDSLDLSKVATIKQEDGKWKVYNKAGDKVLGTHESEDDAKKQLAAIEISKHSAKDGCEHNHPYEPKTEKFPLPDTTDMDKFDKTHPKKRAGLVGVNRGADGKWYIMTVEGNILSGAFTSKEEADSFLFLANGFSENIKRNQLDTLPNDSPTNENKNIVASFKKTAEPTGYNNDGKKDGGWPVEYDRVKKMLESYIRQARTPIADVDLQALKDGKYSRDEIVKFLEKLRKGEEFPPVATANSQLNLEKTADDVNKINLGGTGTFVTEDELLSELDKVIQDEIEGQDTYSDMMKLTPCPQQDNTFAELSGDEAKHRALLEDMKGDLEQGGKEDSRPFDKGPLN